MSSPSAKSNGTTSCLCSASSLATTEPILPRLPVTSTRMDGRLGVDRLAQAADVADRVQPAVRRVARPVVGVAGDGRHMVGSQHAVEADVAPGLHARQQIGLAVVVPGLFELL